MNSVKRASAQVLVSLRTFCSGSFKGHFDSGMRRTFDVYRGACSVQSDSVCNSPILLGNIIYTRIPIIRLLIFYYVHSTSIYITY